MNERVKEVRKTLGLTQAEFGNRLGLTRDAIANIECGRTEVKDIVAKSICREFSISLEWLTYGKGGMLDDDGDAQAVIDSVMMGENEFAKQTLVKFARLSEEHWRQLKAILDELERM